ncbi:hypothetical protein HF670_07320 [Acidithiobacillus thiooxidans]|uniref:hypothetical protein n=1 Tax=Acidithiobacillus thiooxidans TaxID=930 RepID=UPI001C071D2B|nr:hypothetical protein [Acidithiobacillus thiooxidans]MBU2839375.1 hypothetical protein [Acidithiobacillus thiooxidans]
MPDTAEGSYEWPSSENSQVIWKGGPESAFESASKLGGEPRAILYRLRHPQTTCWHSGKDLPYFFENCPYCGLQLKADAPKGKWLPPFGWAPFNGVPKSKRYHPSCLKNKPGEWSIPGDGPLRFWILPFAGSENSGDSYLFAYRLKSGYIYWLDPKQDEFSECTLEGEKDALQCLRGEPLGPARSWSVVWFKDHLFVATRNGLLILDMIAEGKIQVKKVFNGPCLSSPAMARVGQIYFLADRGDGAVSIATLHVDDMDSIQWCDWLEGNSPGPDDLSEISAPVGIEGGDVHWICRRGVVVLEGDQGHWVLAASGIHLETRVQPWSNATGMLVYGRNGSRSNAEFLYYTLSALTSGRDGDEVSMSALPYPSGSDTQWFVNGQSARYQHPDLDGNMEKTDLWPVGAWEAEVGEAKWVAHILVARFAEHVPKARMFGRAEDYDKDVRVTELTVSNNQTSAIHPHGNVLMKLRMPLDTLTIHIGAESILIYKGDTDPSIYVLDLGRSRF